MKELHSKINCKQCPKVFQCATDEDSIDCDNKQSKLKKHIKNIKNEVDNNK